MNTPTCPMDGVLAAGRIATGLGAVLADQAGPRFGLSLSGVMLPSGALRAGMVWLSAC
ncbi:hypothetical protein [uncultured Actinomyces sp.]|uniref:hypothetical protein n=1 Tax=uncultured Actinomyces sp. TaxID=249061 RepID=UPI0028E6279D|nr:hypothetical protein [uncultured Actinomyces sp.]